MENGFRHYDSSSEEVNSFVFEIASFLAMTKRIRKQKRES